jgi:hypothetical protein
VDVKVDVLNAKTKTFYAGKTVAMDDQAGQVSLTITMADQAEEPFLWKVGLVVVFIFVMWLLRVYLALAFGVRAVEVKVGLLEFKMRLGCL